MKSFGRRGSPFIRLSPSQTALASIGWAALAGAGLLACGVEGVGPDAADGPVDETQSPADETVQVRAEIPVLLDSSTGRLTVGASSRTVSASVPISVSLAPSVHFEIDAAEVRAPEVLLPERLSFGSVHVEELFDNNLRVCGSSGHQKCSVARLRMYTEGVSEEGLVNAQEGYGIPLFSGLGVASSEVGLSVGNALLLQEIAIPPSKNVVRLGDFGPAVDFPVEIDFSNAGAGDYLTTLVLEYVLASG